MGRDDTTDKIFPPPEERSGVEAPIPLQPSIRAEFMAHRLHLDRQATQIRQEVAAALARLSPEVTAKSAGRTVLAGALKGGKYGTLIMGVLGILATVAKLWRPELAGPIDTVQQVLEGH